VNAVVTMRRQSGALLLTVLLLLAVMAALAFGLNRAAGMDVRSVAADYERRNTSYLAAAALAAAKWKNQVNKCTANLSVPTFVLGSGTARADVTADKKKINVVATGSLAGGAVATLQRDKVDLVDLGNPETKNLGAGALDTYINSTVTGPLNGSSSLYLASGQSNALLFWTADDIPKNSQIISATLTLVQDGGSATARTVTVQPVTTQWDAAATWSRPRPGVTWAGGDYGTATVASTDVKGPGSYTWDVTGLLDNWVSGRVKNYGMLLRLPNAGQTATFKSMEAESSARPILRVTFVKPC
jgi:hypothetical protein